jgi:hypothetical protein
LYKHYNICWQQAIAFCKKLIGKKTIKKYNIKYFMLDRTNEREYPNSRAAWRVIPVATKKDGTEYESKFASKYYIHNGGNLRYYIDGVTGKLIKKVIIPRANDY